MAGEDKRRDERTAGKQNRMEPEADDQRVERGPKKRGVLPKPLLIMSSVAVVLIVLLTVIVVPVVLLTKTPAPSSASFSGGDMLEYLVQTGNIGEADGLLATWFHRANSKEDMYKALMGDTMILEADVTLMGYGTPDEKPVPIMAHPPDIYSDNTLDEWLDAVLASGKGIKLDFKALESVGLSLDLLKQKESNKGINRPVWLNADILRGPNVPSFVAPVNGSRFLELIQDKFPDVTLSPGWKVWHAHSKNPIEPLYQACDEVLGMFLSGTGRDSRNPELTFMREFKAGRRTLSFKKIL